MVINCKKEKIMKRIYSFVFAAIAILSAASCQKEIVAPEADSNATAFSFVAEREAETKTTLVNGKSTYWTPGDKVSAIDGNGVAVTFSTDITENSSSAVFACPLFTLPEDYTVHAIYPDKTGESGYTLANGVIKNLRVAGTQTAVENSFDPAYAVAYAQGKIESTTVPPTLKFKNIHSLVKFTIGGDKAPSTVKLAHTGYYNLAGLYTYNITTGRVTPGEGAKAITLKPADGKKFEVGKTYYIVIIGGVNIKDMTLSFDETVVKTVEGYEGVKYADESNNWLTGKILNLGTIKFPAENPDQGETEPANFTATAVMSKKSEGSTSYMTTFGGTANADRNIGMDDEYVYIAETQANPVLWKISIADGTASKMPVGTVNGGGTFALACPRVIENTDNGINGGKDVLAVCNMGQGTAVYLYLYANGIENDPVKISMHHDGLGRRLGDQFSVSGSLQSGYAWFKEQGSNAVIFNQLIITSENINRFAKDGIWPDRVMLSSSNTSRGSLYFYPGADWSNALYTSTDASAYTVRDANTLTNDKQTYIEQSWENNANFAGCHGFNFFKVGDRNYIAYTKYSDQTLYIINGTANAAGVKAALEANDVVWSAKIAADGNGCYSGNSGADCAVRTLDDGSVLVAGHIQNVGVVVFKLTLNN